MIISVLVVSVVLLQNGKDLYGVYFYDIHSLPYFWGQWAWRHDQLSLKNHFEIR